MEIAISTSVGRAESLEWTMNRIADAGFRHVEISYYHLQNPDDIGQAVRMARRLDLIISTVHVPFKQLDMSCPDEQNRQNTSRVFQRYITAMGDSRLSTAIVHPNAYNRAENDEELTIRDRQTQKTVEELAEVAQGYDVRLALENMPGKVMRRGRHMRDLKRLVETLKHDHVGLCVDTVHASMNENDPEEEIERAGADLIALHASDSVERRHNHFVPGAGDLDWSAIVASLIHVDYSGVFTMEVYGPREADPAQSEELIRSSYAIGRTLQKQWRRRHQISS